MTFHQLGLNPSITQTVHELGYTSPSPIQVKAIPAVLSGQDILASAQTGTGKTAGFVLPILQQLIDKPKATANRVRVLILTPTRELAAQVYESTVRYGQGLPHRAAVVFGGVKINPQMMKLRGGVEILVATPGRLLDLHQQNALKLDQIDTFVLDEADRMLDMGFIHDIKRIIKLLPFKRQNLMFSATFSEEIRNLAKNILKNPIEIDVAVRNAAAMSVKQLIHPVDKARKTELLCYLIRKNKWDQALVFSRTKHGANKLVKQLNEEQIYAAAIHGNKSQSQRTKALAEFKSGELHILVATDIAARGIDIDQLPCVVNYDLPQVAEDYVHRIGRTGRAGATGIALSLVSADEISQLHSIEKILKRKLDRIEVDDFEPRHNLPQETHPATQKPKVSHQKAQDKKRFYQPHKKKTAAPSQKRREG